jgi:electron transfer flavoprotein alpha subunit
MSETLLFLAHTAADGTLPGAAREALGAAVALAAAVPGSVLCAGLAGVEVQAAANETAGAGCARVIGVSGDAFGQARYATDAAAAEAICRAAGATLVVAAGTSRWQRALPGVTERLGGRADTHATTLSGDAQGVSITRWYYRQRIEASVRRLHRPWAILVDPGCHPPWAGPTLFVPVERIDVPLAGAHHRTQVLGLEAPPADKRTIRPDAPLLFVAGAGWTKKQADGRVHLADAARIIERFLALTPASLGGTKSLVDASGAGQAVLPFMSQLNQVGQTGSTPRHTKGLATCCHGEEPHVVGWRFVIERRAVNLDPTCGWARGKADVVYVADAFEVMERVNELLDEKTATDS